MPQPTGQQPTKRIDAIDPPNSFTGGVSGLAYVDVEATIGPSSPALLLEVPNNTGIYLTRIDVSVLHHTIGGGEPLEVTLQIGSSLTKAGNPTIKRTFLKHLVQRALNGIGIYDQPLPFITPPDAGVFVPANYFVLGKISASAPLNTSELDIFARIFYYI